MYILFDPVQSCIFFYFKTCCFKFEEKRFIRWSLSLFFNIFWGFFLLLFSRPIEFEKKSSLEEFCLSFIGRVNETVGTRVHSFGMAKGGGGVVFV